MRQPDMPDTARVIAGDLTKDQADAEVSRFALILARTGRSRTYGVAAVRAGYKRYRVVVTRHDGGPMPTGPDLARLATLAYAAGSA